MTQLLPPPGAADRMAKLRAMVRGSEFYLALLAAGVGAVTGALVKGMSLISRAMHHLFFGVDLEAYLSSATHLPAASFAVPALGGLALGLVLVSRQRAGRRAAVDPIEANALHGGRMSVRDSLAVAAHTVLSNGCGASVGLEAGYTQIGGALGSRLGQRFHLRRQDMRVLVGCGTAAAIAGAFDAPITGAFYAFELIIGAYAIATAAPVMAAAITAMLTARVLGGVTVPLDIGAIAPVDARDYPFFLALGLASGLVGIAIMRFVALVEAAAARTGLPQALRPAAGGVLVGLMAFVTPQVLSAGHGALHVELQTASTLGVLALAFLMKAAASGVSLGFGFRGGLFFASLFLGALFGKIAAGLVAIAAPGASVDPNAAALVGMGALAVAIVGGPLTMAFLVLETTGDLALTGVALGSAIVSSVTVRELFGYSFSTWRMHLRGETIRSAHDIGWIRTLTVGSMMRTAIRTVRADATLAEFRDRFPLGSASRAVALDASERYAGIVLVADAYAPENEEAGRRVGDILAFQAVTLTPQMNVKQAIEAFDTSESEALAVVDGAASRRVLGLLTEVHALRRYSEELDRARRHLAGDRSAAE